MNEKRRHKIRHDLLIRSLKILNVLLVTVPFVVCWVLYYQNTLWMGSFNGIGNYVIILLFIILYCLLGRTYDAFLVSLNRVSEMVYSQGLAASISCGIMYLVICLLSRRIPLIWPIILCAALQIAIAFIWSCVVQKWYFATFPPLRTFIVYDMRKGVESLINEYGMDKKFRVVGSCSAETCIQKRLAMIDDSIEALYICGVHSHERNIILKYAIERGITVYVIPRIGDVIMSGARKMHMYHLPMLRVDRYDPNPEFVILKRVFDIAVSGIAALLLAPVMLITALAVRSDGGPVLYRQIRLTKDGKEFKLLKFRSMRVDAEKDGVARLSTGDQDDRITKVGKVIRKIRFDELPQLLNILKGDMSIVGPRPERPEIARQYEQKMPEFRLRLQAKAGLTGYAQVYGKYNTTPYDKLQMDLMYIANPSFIEDLRICFATIKILFMPESTEGVADGQRTAMECDNYKNESKI